MASRTGGSLTASSPFASMAQELLDAGVADVEGNSQAPVEDEAVDILEEFDEAGVYEDDANLDPLSAMEKYCRSELPQQRLAYAAAVGAAVDTLQPHEVSGTIVSLLRELLGDVYADVRYTALQQVSPVAQKLRSAGTLYQSDIETLWDLVQKLLLDADVENQEAASSVLAELSHVVAKGNAVAASQKLVLAVQKLQRLPTELQAEGALASLRLIAEVVAPREGSPLTFSTIEEFCVGTYKSMTSSDASADVRQAVALLLPRFARHMPPAQRASLLPNWIKTLAADTHWNVRAEVPQLLVNLLSPKDDKQQQQSGAAADSGSSDGSNGSSRFMHVSGYSVISKLGRVRAGASTAAAGSVADSWGMEDLRLLCDIADKLCKDTSLQVKVAALASLGQLLPLLPTSLATSQRPNLLAHFVTTAKPQAQLAGVRVPSSLCAPRLSGHLAAMRHRQRQQRRQQQRAAEAREQSYQQAVQDMVQEADAIVESELHKSVQDVDSAAAGAESATGTSNSAAATSGSSSSDSSNTAVAAAAARADEQAGSDPTTDQQDAATDRWLLGTANDTPVGADDPDGLAAAGGADDDVSTGASDVASGPSAGGVQQQQQKAPAPAAGTAGAELPCACALHIGKVALHAGPDCWQQLQGAFLELAVAAVNGDCDVAAALLLAFPDLSAALGHQEAATILVPVVLELLHTRLDALTPVLSVTLLDVVSALAPELRICLLQTLPNMALQIDSELAGDWRARLAVAQQLAAVAATVSSAQTAYCLWPLLVTFLRDPVCAVRAAAAAQAGPLLICLPEAEQPAEQTDAQKAAAAAAAAALKSAQEEQQASSSASSSSSVPAVDVAAAGTVVDASASDAAEHAIAAVVATHAVSAPSSSNVTPAGSAQSEQGQQLLQQQQAGQQQQQQQQREAGGPGQRLRWMRRGLSSGLYQLQQQVDRVRESPGLQKVVNGMDQQLTWLQQHPQGKVLWDLGSKLVRGNADLQSGAGAQAQLTVEDLRRQLTSVQVIESAQLDPCKFLTTPAWHALAAELLPFGSSQSCNDRLVLVIAAGSILLASVQRQQQGTGGIQQQQERGGELFLQQVLRQLQQLSADPTPGVRCAVAAVVSKLVSEGTSLQDLGMGADSSTESVRTAATGSTTVSSSTSPSTDPAGHSTDGGSTEGGGGPAVQQGSAGEVPGCSAGGFSSLTSSGILSAPSTALAVLQGCLQRLQRDPCVSVAEAAGFGVGTVGVDSDDAGVAVAAAAEADAAMLGKMTEGDADGGVARVGAAEAADLL